MKLCLSLIHCFFPFCYVCDSQSSFCMDFKLNEQFYNYFDVLIIRFQRMTATLKNNLSN